MAKQKLYLKEDGLNKTIQTRKIVSFIYLVQNMTIQYMLQKINKFKLLKNTQ